MRGRVTTWIAGVAVALSLVGLGRPVMAGTPSVASPVMAQVPSDATPPGQKRDALRRAWNLKAEALTDLRKGHYQEGIAKAREALTLREQALGPDHLDVADVSNLLGHLLERSGDYPAARAAYERALRIREAALGPNHPDVAATLDGLAWVLLQMGSPGAGRPLEERALRIREDALGPQAPEVAASLNDLARILFAQGHAADARPLLERALKIREQSLGPNHPQTAIVHMNLGRVLRELGQYDDARAHLERALEIEERARGPNHPQVAFTLLQLAALAGRLDDYAAAKPLYERALRIREAGAAPNDLGLALIWSDYAVTLRALGDYKGAGEAIGRALAIQEQALGPNHPAVAATLRNRGRLNTQIQSYPAARADLEQALRIYEQALGPTHPQVGLTLFGLGVVYLRTQDNAAAQATFERAVAILRNGGFPEQYWRSAWLLGRLYERQGKQVEAAAAYREAVATIRALAASLQQRQTRAQYLESYSRLDVFDALARVLLRLQQREPTKGYDGEAWAVIEAKKDLLVADALGAAPLKIQDAAAKKAADQLEATRGQAARLESLLSEEQANEGSGEQTERIQALTTRLAQTKAEYLGQAQAFLQRYPRYRAQFVEQETVDPKALAKFAARLPADTLAVQYFAAPDALYLFVVAGGGGFQVKRQALPQADLYDLIKQYRALVERAATRRLPWTDDGSDAYRQDVAPLKAVTARLSATLLEPIEPELRTHTNLILFPNDLLLYLPFHALTRTGPDGVTRFLAETHVVSYVTQLELIDLLSVGRPAPDEPILAVANPDGTLPAASREVRELARLRPDVTTLEGDDATKAKFESLASRFPEIHLATHGVLDPKRPDHSYLVMAGDTQASQRLTVADIAGLSLAPHALAILSGCETALGEQVPGAALVTLAAAFSEAGSQSIIASLWKVNDASTRDFMIALHRALPAVGRAAALQQAELTLLKNPLTAHPYYWAPFLLLGAR